MSYQYGLNGNDVLWELMDGIDYICVDCKNNEEELRAINPEHDVETCDIDDCELCAMENGEWLCEGHTHRYENGLIQDTNSNFVSYEDWRRVIEYLNTEYLVDWVMSGDHDIAQKKAILKELTQRANDQTSYTLQPIGSAHMSNTGGMLIFKMDSEQVLAGIATDHVHSIDVYEIQYRDNFDPDEHESEQYFKYGELEFDLGRFMRVWGSEKSCLP